MQTLARVILLLAAISIAAVAPAQIIGSIISVSTNYTAHPTNRLLVVNASGGAITITLAGATATGGEISILVTDGSHAITVVAKAGNTLIDRNGVCWMGGTGCLSGETAHLISNGLGTWYVIDGINNGCTNWSTNAPITSQTLVPMGTAFGQTLYWNGTGWENSVLLFNNETNVGINTTTPDAGAKLDVNGVTRTLGLTIPDGAYPLNVSGSNGSVGEVLTSQGSNSPIWSSLPGSTDAKADGSTKGIATFKAADFNDDGAGLISLDYANAQMATGSQNGFLKSADWTTFNGKQNALTLGNVSTTTTGVTLGGTTTGAVVGSGVSIDIATDRKSVV